MAAILAGLIIAVGGLFAMAFLASFWFVALVAGVFIFLCAYPPYPYNALAAGGYALFVLVMFIAATKR